MADLDIDSYGISMTTLEEVFIKCNEELHDGEPKIEPGSDEYFA